MMLCEKINRKYQNMFLGIFGTITVRTKTSKL